MCRISYKEEVFFVLMILLLKAGGPISSNSVPQREFRKL